MGVEKRENYFIRIWLCYSVCISSLSGCHPALSGPVLTDLAGDDACKRL